jgi:hypothetical protein
MQLQARCRASLGELGPQPGRLSAAGPLVESLLMAPLSRFHDRWAWLCWRPNRGALLLQWQVSSLSEKMGDPL